jgi:biotin carboxyl carrier protein
VGTGKAVRLRVTVSGATDLVVLLPAGGGTKARDVGEASHGGNDAASDAWLPTALPRSPADAASGRLRFEVVVDGWRFEVVAEDARRASLRERAARASAAQQGTARASLHAQIPGRVTRVWVAAGDVVEQGQRLLAIEAMKMENEIRAPRQGTIERLSVRPGDRVELNDELLTISPAGPVDSVR